MLSVRWREARHPCDRFACSPVPVQMWRSSSPVPVKQQCAESRCRCGEASLRPLRIELILQFRAARLELFQLARDGQLHPCEREQPRRCYQCPYRDYQYLNSEYPYPYRDYQYLNSEYPYPYRDYQYLNREYPYP